MEVTIDNLKDSFRSGYEAFEPSRVESREVWDLYHNKQYTPEQLAILANRGQPAETFNIVKKFARMLIGYYSTQMNTVTAAGKTFKDMEAASIMTDVLDSIFRKNRMDLEGDQIKLTGLISGLLVAYIAPQYSDADDEFGRPINHARIHHVPDSQIVLDPASVLDDYSDARWLHRFKWLTESKLKKLDDSIDLADFEENYNYMGFEDTERRFNYGESFTGQYTINKSYLVVHTVMEDDDGKRWSIYWSNDKIIRQDEITYRKLRWPYRVQKLHSAEDNPEYYGIFREVIQAQHAINQAVLKIQQMVNTEKAFVETDAVESVDDFTTAFNRVNAVIPVLDLNGIKIEKLAGEVQQQYMIINNALDRVQQVLGINDSFLGMAYASDSGRKVKLQQSATIMSLRYVTARIQAFYKSLGEDTVEIVKQFYRAHQVERVLDEVNGERWAELNRPMTRPVIDPNTGQRVEEPIILPVYDPDTQEPMVNDDGNYIFAPVNDPQTELAFNDYEIDVTAVAYNDEDEKAQLLLETMMSGQIGQMTAQINPAGFFRMASLSVRSTKTRFSPDIAQVLSETADMLKDPQANGEAAQVLQGAPGQGGSNPQSRSLKLPQNTNEGVQ